MKVMKFKHNVWEYEMEMTVEVIDMEKLAEQAKQINLFWSDHEHRAERDGGNIQAGLKLFAQECFQQIAFNNFLNAEWLTEQFDWNIPNKGIEGFPNIKEMGIRITHIESWFIDSENIEIIGWDTKL